jgi:hypothetical protein
MAAASAVARARIVNHTITVRAGKEVITPKVLKAGQTVQFSTRGGQFKIKFTGKWPFTGKSHSIIGSPVDQPDQVSTSKVLTLVEGRTAARFECLIKPFGGTKFEGWEYGGEINPRGK